MEIKRNEIWVNGYKAIEVPPAPSQRELPASLRAIKSMEFYTFESGSPLSCVPILVGKERLTEATSREKDPMGGNTVALKEDECCWMCRYSRMKAMKVYVKQELQNVDKEWATFRKNSTLSDPELMKKSFGVTLNRDYGIQILDPNNSLSNAEKQRAAQAITNQKSLHAAIVKHAKLLLELASYYTYERPESQLTIENFSETINYISLLSKNNDRDSIRTLLNTEPDNSSKEYNIINTEA